MGLTAAQLQRLNTNLVGMKMPTPIMTASGTFGWGVEFIDFLDLNQVGGIVVKGTTLKPRFGNAGQRAVETPAGMLNCIGLENPGVEVFLTDILPKLASYSSPVIVNIAGNTPEEYGEVAKYLDVPGVAAIELNISCPNVKEGGIAFGVCPDSASQVVHAVKRATNKPVITKLSPNVTDIVAMAQAVEQAGSDAICMINTLVGMKIDIHTQKPVLGNIMGGLSGPAIRPVAVRMVYQVAQKIKIPIIGMGGIMTAEDAVEFLLAGASAVAVGTANFVNPSIAQEINYGILAYLDKYNYKHVQELVGLSWK